MGSLLIYITVLSTGAIFLSASKKKWALSAIFGLALVIIFAAGRFEVGTDSVTYAKLFSRNAAMKWDVFFDKITEDILFHGINKIAYSLGGIVLTWGVIAAFTVIPIYTTLKNEYPDISVGASMMVFLFLMYTTAFNVAREYVAVAIVFWGLKYVFQSKFIPFALCVFVAGLFHKSAFIAIILWLFWSHKNKKAITGWLRAFLIGLAALAVVGYQEIISFITSRFTYFEDYESYAIDSYVGANRDFYLNLLVLLVILVVSKNLKEHDPRLDYMLSLLIIATLIGLTGFSHPQVKRIAYYFSTPAELTIFGYLPKSFKRLDKSLVMVFIVAYVIARFTLTAYILGQGHLIPYEFKLFYN